MNGITDETIRVVGILHVAVLALYLLYFIVFHASTWCFPTRPRRRARRQIRRRRRAARSSVATFIGRMTNTVAETNAMEMDMV